MKFAISPEQMQEVQAQQAEMGISSDPFQMLQQMLRALKEFTGDAPQMDDITMVALEKRNPSA
jgi:serine phosphatase RsbU (regulator of sigma subunit)